MKMVMHATYRSNFNMKLLKRFINQCAILTLILFIAIPSMGDETLKDISFENGWPEVPRSNLASDKDGNILFYSVGDTLVILDGAGLTENARILLNTKKGITGIAYDSSSKMVYASCGSGGFQVIDVADTMAPKIMGELRKDHKSSNIYGSAVDYLDNRAYLADFFFGLRIIDVSNPSNPNQSGYHEEFSEYADESNSFSGGHVNVKAVVLNDTKYAFVLDYYYGLRVFDVTVDTQPILVDRFDMRTSQYYGQVSLVKDLAIDANHVYISDTTYGLTTLSIFSDSANPLTVNLDKVGQIETPGAASGISLNNNMVYVADGLNGLFAVDVLDRTDPVHAGTYETSGVYGVHAPGGKIFVADTTDGLASVEETGAFVYSKTGFYDPPCDADAVFVEGSYAYVLDDGGAKDGLHIIDLASEGEYQLVGQVSTPGEANALHVMDSHAYIADGSAGISVLDVSDKSAPVFLYGFKGESSLASVSDITMVVKNEEKFVFYTDSNQGLFTAGVDDQDSLYHKGSIFLNNAGAVALFAPPGNSGEVKLYALVVNGTGLVVIDVTDPIAPSQVSSFDTPGNALDIGVKDEFAVVADGEGGVVLIDLSDPIKPKTVATYATEGRAEAISIHQSYIHTAVGTNGLRVLGIADTAPVTLSLIAYNDTPGYASCVFVAGDDTARLTYLGDSRGGLLSFLHSDSYSDGIDEKPFTTTSHDSGWDRLCFISTLF